MPCLCSKSNKVKQFNSVIRHSSNESSGSAIGVVPNPIEKDLTSIPGSVNDTPDRKQEKLNLISCIKDGDTASALSIINSGTNINQRGMWENTPLIVACSYSETSIAEELIGKKCDVNLKNETGVSALLHASIEGLETVVLSLLNAGANPNPPPAKLYNRHLDTYHEYTPLTAAASSNFPSICQTLLNHNSSTHDSLFQACYHSNHLCTKIILQNTTNIYYKDEKTGWTCLDAAVAGGKTCDVESLKLLLSKGIDVNDSRCCLLGTAITRRSLDAVELLLECKADVDRPMEDNSTRPIHKACRNPDPQYLSLLLKHNATIDESLPDLIRRSHRDPSQLLECLQTHLQKIEEEQCKRIKPTSEDVLLAKACVSRSILMALSAPLN